MTQESINDAIWSGNYWGPEGAVARAYREYEAAAYYFTDESPEALVEKRFVYMNALYSAFGSIYPAARQGNLRAVWGAVRLLARLRPFLLTYVETASTALRLKLPADRLEMLGAMLVRYADVPLVGGRVFREAAVEYALAAHQLSRHDSTSHTPALAALTLARAAMAASGDDDNSFEHLRFAERQSRNVANPDQRSRILRSLGELWAMRGDPERGRALLEHAETVPGISMDVREKVIAMKGAI